MIKRLLVLLGAISVLYGCVALAQSAPPPPTRPAIDARSVNVTTGDLVASITDVVIGPSDQHGLQYTRQWMQAGWRQANIPLMSGSTSSPVVSFMGHSFSFTSNGSTYVADNQDGSTLSSDRKTFVAGNGTTITFDPLRNRIPYVSSNLGIGTIVVFADGTRLDLTYKTGTYDVSCDIDDNCVRASVYRLSAIVSSTGYQLKIAYSADFLTDAASVSQWSAVTRVTALNNAIEYCSPTADSCSFVNTWPHSDYGYDGSYRLTSAADAEGRATTYTYNASNYLSSMKMPLAAVDTVDITYQASSAKVATIKVAGQTWSYTYNTGSTTVSDPYTHPRSAAFDASSLLVSSDTNENGWVTSYIYCKSTDPVQSNGVQCPVNLLKKVTMPQGNATAYEYDARGNVTKLTLLPKIGSTPTLVTSATYPTTCSNAKVCNQPVTATDQAGQVTNYAYDASSGIVSTVTAPAPGGGVTVRPEVRTSFITLQAWVKNSSGSLALASAATRYPQTLSTCKAGDATSGCIGTTNETVTTLGYDSIGALCSGCGTNVLFYTATVRSGNSDAAQTRTVTLTHDNIGNVTSQSDGAGNVAQMTYNKARQLTGGRTADPDGSGPKRPRAVAIHYLGNGLPDSITQGTANSDGSSFTEIQYRFLAYDDYGRVTKDWINQAGTDYAMTQTSYDVLGRTDCVATRMDPSTYPSLPASACTLANAAPSDPNKLDRITKYTWEYASGLDHTTSGYGTTAQTDDVHYVHNSNGQVVLANDGKGNQTSYTYDGLDRLIRTCFNAARANCDANTAPDKTQVTYGTTGNGTGRVVAKGLRGHSDAIVIGYTYDALGRLSFTDYIDGPFDRDVTYTYDNLSRLTLAVDANSHAASFGYDALGRVTSQGDSLSTRTMQYDGAGRRTRLTWGDGFYVTYQYDPTGAMTAIRENGSGLLASFAYDDLGRRVTLTRGNGVASNPGYIGPYLSSLGLAYPNSANNITYLLYRGAGGLLTQRVGLNDAYTWNGHYNVDRLYQSNALNQYTQSGSVTPTYDIKGNLASAGGPSYAYNENNALVTSSAGPQFYYDPLGRMDSVLNTPTARGLQYDGDEIVAEYDPGSHAILRRYVFGPDTIQGGGDEPLVWYEGAGTSDKRYLSADERGSIVAVTDAAGNLMRINTYDESGIPGAGNLGMYQYTGQAWLPELGMYNYKARIYSPTLGRFMQPDPIGYGDGMNWYAYAHGDPVNMVDSSGLEDNEIVVTANRPSHNFLYLARFTVDTSSFSAHLPDFDKESGSEDHADTVDCNKNPKDARCGPQSPKPKPNPCQSLGNRIGNALENAGKGVSYSGLTIAGIGAFAGPEGAVPGLFITEVGGVLSTLGQVSQDVAFGRPFGEIAARAAVNAFGARAVNNVVPRSVRSGIGDAIFGQAIGEVASATNASLDPDRCPK